MKPLREHYTQPTDQGDMLNVFDYIDALEKYIEELSPTNDEDSLPASLRRCMDCGSLIDKYPLFCEFCRRQ